MLTKLTLFNERDIWQAQEELIRMLLVKCPQVELETLNSRRNWNLGMLVFEEGNRLEDDGYWFSYLVDLKVISRNYWQKLISEGHLILKILMQCAKHLCLILSQPA